jgi:LacI family transcriptional regulator
VRAWVRENRPWSIRLTEQGRGAAVPKWLKGWDGDGVIARVESVQIARELRATGLPVIDVSAALPRLEFPRVATAAEGAAELAATHLLERGLTNFAYCGDRRYHWARQRGEAFARLTGAMGGGPCASFAPTPGAVDEEVGEIARWLKTLPRPVGVLACLDLRGQQVLAACRLAGLNVPEEVAVIGVHNDELLCDLCDPPLSSVIPNAQRAGYEAAALLARAMAGKCVPVALREISPQGVAARQSTDLAAVSDAKIAGAVRFMREQAAGGANVGDVLRAVPMARTALERRFKAALGTTPHAHLRKLRIERVKELLVSTSLPVGEIATATGFEHPEYLSAMFRRECGVSPRDFRSQHRAKVASQR